MKTIEINSHQLTSEKLELLCHLIYYDGPLLSLYKGSDFGEDNVEKIYFSKWVDVSAESNQWLLFEVSFKSLIAFFQGKISIRSLIFKNEFCFLQKTGASETANFLNLTLVNFLPEDYLPSDAAFFDESLYTQEAINFAQKLLALVKQHEISSWLPNFLAKKDFLHTA